ncbi:MAG: hypothetical protein IKP88_02205 [Lachnospiraceae bacterium]|nr:hypothetical protein [Lachnospiraceae bacterium]
MYYNFFADNYEVYADKEVRCMIYGDETDFVLYTDPECTKPADPWDGQSDIVLYLKTVK